MDFVQIKEWLDKLVDNINERKALADFNNQIKTSNGFDDVLVFEGIEIIAEAVGEELVEEEIEDSCFRYSYSFMYRGIEIHTFSEERLPEFEEGQPC